MTTPLEREILAHYWCYPEPFRGGSEHWAPAVARAVQRFLDMGLLTQQVLPVRKVFANREALKPYMDALAAVPLPVQAWVVPS